jgi:hypothetical protein
MKCVFILPCRHHSDVPSWLKGLRLHKYAHLFSLLTYDEMLALTEEQLELQGVTKGARHKIALSILRLRERPTLLAQLEKVRSIFDELKNKQMSLIGLFLKFLIRRSSTLAVCITH